MRLRRALDPAVRAQVRRISIRLHLTAPLVALGPLAVVVIAATMHAADPLVLALCVVSLVSAGAGVLIFVCAMIAQELLRGCAADTAPSHRVLDHAEKHVARTWAEAVTAALSS